MNEQGDILALTQFTSATEAWPRFFSAGGTAVHRTNPGLITLRSRRAVQLAARFQLPAASGVTNLEMSAGNQQAFHQRRPLP